jgi:hypothetical protein
VKDKYTKKYRGFGFITYIRDESAQELLANKDFNFIRGKLVDCKVSVPVEEQAAFKVSRRKTQKDIKATSMITEEP